MIVCTTLIEAALVPGVIHRRIVADHVEAYQVGEEYTVAAFTPEQTPAQVAAILRAQADVSLSADEPDDKRYKALLLVFVDEINEIRASLAQPQVARTMVQEKSALIAKIDAGLADGQAIQVMTDGEGNPLTTPDGSLLLLG